MPTARQLAAATVPLRVNGQQSNQHGARYVRLHCIALHALLRLSHAGRRTYIQYSSVVLGDSSLGWWKQECVLNQLSALTRRESAFSSTYRHLRPGKDHGQRERGRERNPSKLAHARHTERRQIKGEGSSEGRHSPIGSASARPPSPSVRPVCHTYTTLASCQFPSRSPTGASQRTLPRGEVVGLLILPRWVVFSDRRRPHTSHACPAGPTSTWPSCWLQSASPS